MSELLDTLTVDLGTRSYPIYIGRGLLRDAALLKKHLAQARCAVISDTTVAEIYLDDLKTAVSKRYAVDIVISPGEEQKKLSSVENISSVLLENLMTRQDFIIALGGGVVGDLAGFTAACYQRGIRFIQIPTTLLAQVDSSVGGKTGVNHPLGKNMIGAFYQPAAVIIDLDTLQSLPERQVSAGIAEIIKYGLITDSDFFGWLESNINALKSLNPDALVYAIRRSCEIKAQIVSQDERETNDCRALLNLGHTFGHAIETAMHYEGWLHGEAVGCGMVLAARLSARCGLLSDAQVQQITNLIKTAELPVTLPAELDARQLISLMRKDKKNIGGRQRFILLKDVGHAYIDETVSEPILHELLTGN